MAMMERLVSADFRVKLTEQEVALKQEELVELHMEGIKKDDELSDAQEMAKRRKKDLEAHMAKARGVARICHDKAENIYVVNAKAFVDTDTWLEVVHHKDGRVLRERIIPEEERGQFRQITLFKDEAGAESQVAPRKAKRSPKVTVTVAANDDAEPVKFSGEDDVESGDEG